MRANQRRIGRGVRDGGEVCAAESLSIRLKEVRLESCDLDCRWDARACLATEVTRRIVGVVGQSLMLLSKASSGSTWWATKPFTTLDGK
jgi:hypothetical protein